MRYRSSRLGSSFLAGRFNGLAGSMVTAIALGQLASLHAHLMFFVTHRELLLSLSFSARNALGSDGFLNGRLNGLAGGLAVAITLSKVSTSLRRSMCFVSCYLLVLLLVFCTSTIPSDGSVILNLGRSSLLLLSRQLGCRVHIQVENHLHTSSRRVRRSARGFR